VISIWSQEFEESEPCQVDRRYRLTEIIVDRIAIQISEFVTADVPPISQIFVLTEGAGERLGFVVATVNDLNRQDFGLAHMDCLVWGFVVRGGYRTYLICQLRDVRSCQIVDLTYTFQGASEDVCDLVRHVLSFASH
jgi:hypothetical protein